MIHHGDLFDVLPTLDAESIDAGVTDPPYGIGFMGKQWDTFKPDVAAKKQGLRQLDKSPRWREGDRRLINPNLKGRTVDGAISSSQIEYDRSLVGQRGFQEWTEKWAREVYRVLKPGAYLMVCGAPRSYHRMASGLEDAGFEIRDCFCWLFGQGFPKSLNVGDGRGTALKPAYEPIVLARKPFKGSLTANLEKYGTGAINIDTCRIGTSKAVPASPSKNEGSRIFGKYAPKDGSESGYNPGIGRWPANVCLDEEVAAMLDEQSGERRSAGDYPSDEVSNGMFGRREQSQLYADSGGASRFFYVAKPSRKERDLGCYDLPERTGAGRTSILNTSEIVYTDPLWVNAVLAQRLQADTEASRPKVIGGSTTQTSDGSAWSMCWCGSPSTDPYHPVVKSIIETETSWTTASTISNSSRRPHTNGCMVAAFGVKAAGGNLAAYAEFQSPWRRLTGISRKKAGPSTDGADLATSVSSWLTSKPEGGGGRRVGGARNIHPT